jgi:foldase protein PrsA
MAISCNIEPQLYVFDEKRMISILKKRLAFLSAAVGLLIAFSSQGLFAQAPPSMPPPPAEAPAAPANFPPPPVPGGPPGVVAVVNGVQITKAQLVQVALTLAGQHALQQLIANTLVLQAAQQQGITVTPAEIDARFTELKSQLATGYQGGLQQFMIANNTTIPEIKQDLKVSLLAEKVALHGKPAVHMAHIHYLVVLTANPSNSPLIKPHTVADAKAIIAQAQAALKSGESFESVVAKYSEDPGKNNGGDIGVIGPESVAQYDPTFVKAALALKPGEVSQPIYSPQFGYFLLKCVSTSEDPINVETKMSDQTLYDPVEQQLAQEAAQQYFQTILKSAKIVNYMMP